MARFIDEISIDGNSENITFSLCEGDSAICQMDFVLRTLDSELMNFDWDWVYNTLDEERVIYSWNEDVRVSYSYNIEEAANYLDDDMVVSFFEAAINNNGEVNFEECAREIDYALNKALR